MKKFLVIFLIVFVLSVTLMKPDLARAHVNASVVDVTVAVDSTLRSAVDAWLAVSPPVPLPYYAITYIQQRGAETFVSLAALNISSATDAWHATDNAAWMGSVLVSADGSVTMLSKPQAGLGLKVFAMPNLAPGGGSNIRFPWEAGKKMMYGEAAVHAAGGGGAYATGFDAVDFLGGNDLGSGVAKDAVYAAFAGTVDYVCADDTTTLVRVVDEATNNRFIYAHLLDNVNLAEEHEFTKGALIGTLKHGSFDDTCGYAEQTDQHYHLHFGFEADSGSFRMENCILNMSNEKWTCGTKVTAPGEYLIGSGSSVDGGTTSGDVQNPSFWDMAVTGAVALWTQVVIDKLPEHQAMQFVYVIYNTVKLMLRIAYVMVYSNINLGHLMAAVLIAIVTKTLFGIAEFIVFLFKAWKSLVLIIGA